MTSCVTVDDKSVAMINGFNIIAASSEGSSCLRSFHGLKQDKIEFGLLDDCGCFLERTSLGSVC